MGTSKVPQTPTLGDNLDPYVQVHNKMSGLQAEMQEQQQRLNPHSDCQSKLRAKFGALSCKDGGWMENPECALKTLSEAEGMDTIRETMDNSLMMLIPTKKNSGRNFWAQMGGLRKL